MHLTSCTKEDVSVVCFQCTHERSCDLADSPVNVVCDGRSKLFYAALCFKFKHSLVE